MQHKYIERRREAYAKKERGGGGTSCGKLSARRGHFITFIAHPPSPSTLSGVNVEEDIQQPVLPGKCVEHVGPL